MPSYESGAKYLDGLKLAAWVEPYLPEGPARKVHDNWYRSLKRGAITDVYKVDKHLCKLGLHLAMIPDDCWLERTASPRGRPRAAA